MKKIALGFMVSMAFLSLGGCKKKGSSDAGQAIAKLSEFADKMCACQDPTCAKKVTDEMSVWSQEQAKLQKEPPSLNEADTKRTKEIGARMNACTEKAMTPAAPAEGSAAGSADGSAAAGSAEGSAAAPAAGSAEGSAAAPAAGSAK